MRLYPESKGVSEIGAEIVRGLDGGVESWTTVLREDALGLVWSHMYCNLLRFFVACKKGFPPQVALSTTAR